MLGKLLPLLIALAGLGGGIGAGLALRPAPEPALVAEGSCPCDCGAPAGTDTAAADTADAGEVAHNAAGAEGEPTSDFVKINNQFVVPVVKGEDIAALVVMSISLEVPTGGSEKIYQREPKLRDLFLQVLFDHANSGGFDGAFTAGPPMQALRTALLETARRELGNNVSDILITDIARQDI